MLISKEQHQSSLTLLLGIWSHLSRQRRTQLGFLLIVMLISAGAEVVSLGAVIPFLAVLTQPDLVWQLPLFQNLGINTYLTDDRLLLLLTTLVFVMAAILAALVRLINLWLNGRLAAAIGSDLSCEAYFRTLYQPYSVHVRRNSASVMTGITTSIQFTVLGLNSLLQLVTSATVAFGLLTALVLIDASVAIGAAALFGTIYQVLGITASRELRNNSLKIAEASNYQLKALQEGLGAIRDVLLDGTQPLYLKIYQQSDRPQRELQAKNIFLGAYPRFALEALGMISIALFGGVLLFQRGSGTSVIPLLGALALGAQRLLPALQHAYSGWAALKGYSGSMADVLSLLNQPLPPPTKVSNQLVLHGAITLSGIHFSYDPEEPEVLRGLDLEIRRGERIGLIGSSGSGKSTTVDILMGLLVPTTGQLLVDGVDIHDPEHPEHVMAWRSSIAHVPQNIFLADTSIAENIAFGVPRSQIDLGRVKIAAEQAQIASFIEESPEGYKTFVGERGIRLSGGQRQRIGIARALYKKSQVLVFDEATSALDTDTEEAVISSLRAFAADLTIVMIAHRLSTLECCDRVIRLENGKAVDNSLA